MPRVLGGWAFSNERGDPVDRLQFDAWPCGGLLKRQLSNGFWGNLYPCLGEACGTGVPRPKENAFFEDPTVGLCLGPYDSPRGVAFSYERGTPVGIGASG